MLAGKRGLSRPRGAHGAGPLWGRSLLADGARRPQLAESWCGALGRPWPPSTRPFVPLRQRPGAGHCSCPGASSPELSSCRGAQHLEPRPRAAQTLRSPAPGRPRTPALLARRPAPPQAQPPGTCTPRACRAGTGTGGPQEPPAEAHRVGPGRPEPRSGLSEAAGRRLEASVGCQDTVVPSSEPGAPRKLL